MTGQDARPTLEGTVDVVAGILQEVNDLPPWAYTYTERPDDLLEVRASELEAILRAHLLPARERRSRP